jgi:hypothetical protein
LKGVVKGLTNGAGMEKFATLLVATMTTVVNVRGVLQDLGPPSLIRLPGTETAAG